MVVVVEVAGAAAVGFLTADTGALLDAPFPQPPAGQ